MKSISRIALKHQLSADASADEIRKQLRYQLSALHPDKSGGSFESETDKQSYYGLQESLKELDELEQSSRAVVPISQLPALISALTTGLQRDNIKSSDTLHIAAVADMRTRISRRYSGPKIGSGVFAAISAFLFGVAEKLKDNPVLGPAFSDPSAQALLLMLALLSGMIFIFTWAQERRAESVAEFLMSERALIPVFRMLQELSVRNGAPPRINSQQILEAVAHAFHYRGHPAFSLFPWSRRIDPATLEKAAEIQTQRLVERGVLKRAPINSVVVWYDLSTSE